MFSCVAATSILTTIFAVGCSSPASHSGTSNSAASTALPAAFAAGEWTIQDATSPVSPSDFWVDDITVTVTNDTSGTFTGTMGCGVSGCSGHVIQVSAGGIWSLDEGPHGPQIKFVFPNGNGNDTITEFYTYAQGASAGSLVLTYEDDNYGTSNGSNGSPNTRFTLALGSPALPTAFVAGEWTIQGSTSPVSPSNFWVDDITVAVTDETSGTFTGTMGCGISGCSGAVIPVPAAGMWSLDEGPHGPQIKFVFPNGNGNDTITEFYTYAQGASAGSLVLTYEDDNYGTSNGPNGSPNAPFTLASNDAVAP